MGPFNKYRKLPLSNQQSFFPFQTNFIDVSTFLARRHVMHVYRSRQKFVFSLKHVPKKLPPQMVIEKFRKITRTIHFLGREEELEEKGR
jgi:hypothetical protein